jgi:hypothetical protein
MVDPLVVKALVVALFTWIGANTPYEVPEDSPTIVLAPSAMIQAVGCKSTPCGVLGFIGVGDPSKDIPTTIFLDNRLQLETNVCARSILLHELIHVVQPQNPRFAGMDEDLRYAEKELDADQWQKEFLIENGEQPYVRGGIPYVNFLKETCGPPNRRVGHWWSG